MNNERNFGLDLIRFIAIFLVVIVHSSFFLNQNFINSIYIIDGVDLFFVLSGFLIGKIIINNIIVKNKIEFKDVKSFLIRRWFRTIPNYVLFLIINIVLIYFNLIDGFLNKYLITYFIFFQNLYKPYDFLFWESWSLCVEEWFYLTFPFLIYIINKINKNNLKFTFILSICIFITVPLLLRISKIEHNINHSHFDLFFRKIVIFRLDTIGFGILGAYFSYYYRQILFNYKLIFFVIGLFGILYLNYYKFPIEFEETFKFSLSSLFIVLLFPYFENISKNNPLNKPITFISKISFSIYLIHMPLMKLFSQINIYSNKYYYILMYLVFIVSLVILSYICFRYYESTFLKLRDRFFKKIDN